MWNTQIPAETNGLLMRYWSEDFQGEIRGIGNGKARILYTDNIINIDRNCIVSWFKA